VAAKDSKERTVLSEQQIAMVTVFLSKMRKTDRPDEVLRDVKDVREVLQALTLSGYAIVPQHALNAMKQVLLENDL
jgi:hypothetical protein